MSFAYLIFWRINQNAYPKSFPALLTSWDGSEVRSICLSKVLKSVMLDYLLRMIIICNDILTLLITYQNFIFGPSIFITLNSISYEWIVYFSLIDGLLLLILIFYGVFIIKFMFWMLQNITRALAYHFLSPLHLFCSCVLEHKWPPGDLTCL